jgi:non-canonical (house-cleaning) NTP pyrophosphatase
MSASYFGSSDLHSVVLSDGAVILGEGTDVRARSLIERYILERLRSGESLGSVAQSLMVLEHADLESAQRAVDEFTSGLLSRRTNEGLDMMHEWDSA